MSLDILPYNLPDAALVRSQDGGGACSVFVPERVMVVIGKGSDVELELNAEAITADHVRVLRRATGGCAVVLTPEMAAVSFALYTKDQKRSSDYFREFNAILINALETLGVKDPVHAGTSDIALGGRKIAGTAIYRNKDMVFYHAILNLAGGTEIMERYLTRPPRMPEYRAGRSHSEFVTSLQREGYSINMIAFRTAVEMGFRDYLSANVQAAKSEA